MREITRIITPCRCGKCIYCEFGGNPPAQIIEKETVCGDCERKDKLIEQMRDALIQAKDNFETMDKIMSTPCAPIRIVRAAYDTGLSYLDDAIEAALAAERASE